MFNIIKMHSSYASLITAARLEYPDLTEERATAEVNRISVLSQDVRGLANKRVLDIGGGSETSTDRYNFLIRLYQKYFDREAYSLFHPWYCRILKQAGACPEVLDVGDNSGEKFPSHQLDVTKPDAFVQFPDGSFDAVNNYKCTVPRNSKHAERGTSPGIYFAFARKHRSDDVRVMQEKDMPYSEWAAFMRKANCERVWALNDNVFHNVERILKHGGIYTLAEFVFRKRKGGLHKEKVLQGLGS